MTDLPTPRYAIGQVVYRPTTDRTTETLSCPDCRGSRVWRAVSPAGEEHEISCPRCTDRYAHSGTDQLPNLKITRYTPIVQPLTIGAITVKTHPYHGDDHVEYGTESGSRYYERQFHDTEAAALAVAEAEAAVQNAKIDTLPEVTRARRFSGLTYTDAATAALKDGIFNSWQAFRSLGYALDDALPKDPNDDTETEGQIREALERYAKYGGTYLPVERHPIDALLEAIAAYENRDHPPASLDQDLAGIREAIANLKAAAGFPNLPEAPPCTCEFLGRYSRNPTCPRHGQKEEDI